MNFNGPIQRFPTWTDPRTKRVFSEDLYLYTAPVIASLAPAAQAVSTVQFQEDSVFEWVSTTFQCQTASTAGFTLTPNITVNLQDGSSQKNLTSIATPIGSLIGTGQLPFILPVPRRFMPNGSLICTFVNFDSAITYDNLYLTLIGKKIFDLSD
jgi:hypothetical protein